MLFKRKSWANMMPEFLFLFIRRLLVSFRKTACDFPGRCRGFSPGNRIFALMKTILCTFFACALFCAVDVRAQQTPPSGAAFIAVCKESMTLAVYDFNSCLRAVYPIACGRALGNKEKPGDMKTPEGLSPSSRFRTQAHGRTILATVRGRSEGPTVRISSV